VVLTVSRMGLATVAVGCAPCLVRLARRPAVALTLVLAGGVSLDQLQRAHTDQASFEHLEYAFQAARLELMEEALEEFWERPWLGLATSRNHYAYDEQLNAHNAYVEMLFLGGVCYAGPIFVMLAYAVKSALACWRRRKQSPYDELLIATLAALFAASVANGLVNNIIHYPTYSWAFVHVLLCHAFISVRRDMASRTPVAARRPGRALSRGWGEAAGAFVARPAQRTRGWGADRFTGSKL
jgi:hypothetical protein